MEGKIKFFNAQKGFGFIIGEDDNEYFVHITEVLNDAELLEETAVIFEPVEGDRGVKATKVSLA